MSGAFNGTPGTNATEVETQFGLLKYNQPERIPLDEFEERIRRKQPFAFRVNNLQSWPGQRFEFAFEYSNPGQRWHWSVTHLNRDEELIRDPVILDYPYRYRNLFVAYFRAPPGSRPERVNHQNLGSSVRLSAYPGPESPSYPFDLSNA